MNPAKWRTRVALVGLALAAASVTVAGVAVSSSSGDSKVVGHARLLPLGTRPLRVKGTGFHPGERVRLEVSGTVAARRSVKAGSRGSFAVIFSGVEACGSVTVTTRGSRGSRADFNFSQVACVSP